MEFAAQTLSRSRFFSKQTLCADCDKARALLRRLALSDDTDSKEEKEDAAADIESQDPEKIESRAGKALARWMPTAKDVAELCPQPVSRPPAPLCQGAEATQELDDRAADDRKRYSIFEKTTVLLESSTDKEGRSVLELKDSISDVEVYDLLNTEDVRSLKVADRVRLMHILVRAQFDAAGRAYDMAMKDYLHAVEELRRQETEIQAELLRSMKVVGLTITGAAISRDILQKLAPRTVLIEEAAEVLEPLLIAALGNWVERLILIGDNQQLPPQVEVHRLAQEFNFNTSLMHRLIANKLPLVTLNSQSRMMPEFAALLSNDYPNLVTSKRVDVAQRLSPPAGFVNSMWFWNVEAGDTLDKEGRSHVNLPEVNAVLALVHHLLRSGIEPQMITVLAPYAAQVEILRQRVLQVVRAESKSTWPTAAIEGVAAQKQLRALKAEPHCDSEVVLGVAKTFLLLGMIDEASKAIVLACKNARTSSADIQTYLERINIMITQRDCVNDFCSNPTQDDPGEAINSLKKLEGCATQWRQESIPLAAAACSLRSRLAAQVSKAPGIHEKQKGFLKCLESGADKTLLDLRAKDDVCVSTIDRYQGSENDIVIISLVRTQGVGFLNEPARRVVAQSRARLGMYFVGNIKNYSKIPHWKTLISAMQQQHRSGDSIPLCCALHDASRCNLPAKDAAQVERLNFCKKPCGQLMGCGIHK